MKRLLFVVIALCAIDAFSQATVVVDAADVRRGVFHTHLTIPVAAGPMTLVYPKWIPGEHMPTGPVMQMAGFHVHARERELAWSRDPVDPFAVHLDVPAAIDTIDVDFDYLSPSSTFGAGYGEAPNATPNLALTLFTPARGDPPRARTDPTP